MQERHSKEAAQRTGLKGMHLPMNASGLELPCYFQLLVAQTEEGEIFLQRNCGQRTLRKMAISFILVIPTRIHQQKQTHSSSTLGTQEELTFACRLRYCKSRQQEGGPCGDTSWLELTDPVRGQGSYQIHQILQGVSAFRLFRLFQSRKG